MKIVDASPSPRAHIAMLSRIGYSFNSAIGDIVDNSVSAKATRIDIQFLEDNSGPFVEISDDGVGMTQAELLTNMAIGCKDPSADREIGDLGRFGAGLKTASFSQARVLTVASKAIDTNIVVARWDLDFVTAEDKWSLQTGGPNELSCGDIFDSLGTKDHGTLVRWDALTDFNSSDSSAEIENQIAERCAGLHKYLGLYFHRFMQGSTPVSFYINNLYVEPIDPFMRDIKGFEEGQSTSFRSKQGKIEIKAYQLPHASNISQRVLDKYGGKSAIRQGQGLYVYRERRLIIAGGWMGLKNIDALGDLARIQVDIPAALDHEWGTDVKKSSLQIPHKVRAKLRGMLDSPIKKSKRAYEFRGNLESASEYWNIRDKDRDGLISYEVNFDNEKLSELLLELGSENKKKLLLFLSQLASDLPLNHIYKQMSDSPTEIDQVTLSAEERIDELFKRFANE